MAETTKLQVAIIGAGIAGLAAAIGLRDHPAIDVQIYERAAELREIGASIALGPNGMRTLDRLGVDNALDDSVAFRNKSRHPMIYRYGHLGNPEMKILTCVAVIGKRMKMYRSTTIEVTSRTGI